MAHGIWIIWINSHGYVADRWNRNFADYERVCSDTEEEGMSEGVRGIIFAQAEP